MPRRYSNADRLLVDAVNYDLDLDALQEAAHAGLDALAPWEARDAAELRRRFGAPYYVTMNCECGGSWPYECWAVGGSDWSPIGCPICGEEDEPKNDRMLTRLERERVQQMRRLRGLR